MDAKRKLSNQGANDENLIVSHSIGNSYLVEMRALFSEINLTDSNSETDEITRSWYAKMDGSRRRNSTRQDGDETRVDLSTTLSCALNQIPDLASNPKLGFEAISTFIDEWSKDISAVMGSFIESLQKIMHW